MKTITTIILLLIVSAGYGQKKDSTLYSVIIPLADYKQLTIIAQAYRANVPYINIPDKDKAAEQRNLDAFFRALDGRVKVDSVKVRVK